MLTQAESRFYNFSVTSAYPSAANQRTMELTSEQQIFEFIKKSGKILIALPQNLTADSLASGLALRLFLARLQKDVTVVSAGKLPENLKFLPGADLVQNQVEAGKSLTMIVDTANKKMDEVSYQAGPDKVHIYIKSKGEPFAPEDVSFAQEKFPVDLIMILGAKSLEDLGKLQELRADLFFETPKINIDNSPQNEYFGQVNLVDVTAASVAEILAQTLQKYEEQLVDEDIATCLLAGIIAQTHSFQHAQTTPKTFLKASELVSLGGRQQEIIKNIFKTKSLSLLRLWGRALARMKTLEDKGVIYSLLNFTDFEKAEAGADELLPTLSELAANLSGYKVVGLLAEPAKDLVQLLAAVHEQLPAGQFLQRIDGSEAKILDTTLGNFVVIQAIFPEISLEEAENKFLYAVKNL